MKRPKLFCPDTYKIYRYLRNIDVIVCSKFPFFSLNIRETMTYFLFFFFFLKSSTISNKLYAYNNFTVVMNEVKTVKGNILTVSTPNKDEIRMYNYLLGITL